LSVSYLGLAEKTRIQFEIHRRRLFALFTHRCLLVTRLLVFTLFTCLPCLLP
jgi:hypothetical protein